MSGLEGGGVSRDARRQRQMPPPPLPPPPPRHPADTPGLHPPTRSAPTPALSPQGLMRERAHRPKETEGGEQRRPPEIVVVVPTKDSSHGTAPRHTVRPREGVGGGAGGPRPVSVPGTSATEVAKSDDAQG